MLLLLNGDEKESDGLDAYVLYALWVKKFKQTKLTTHNMLPPPALVALDVNQTR